MRRTTEVPGYSGTPLAKKLGIKPGFRIRPKNEPTSYGDLVGIDDSVGVAISSRFRANVDLWHLFTRSDRELADTLPLAMRQIVPDGMIWVSWPKRSSGVSSQIGEDDIRRHALPLGLVDVKVCAVDDVWSGLKLVIRKERRTRPSA